MADDGMTVGVLALQGAVVEHVHCLQRLGCRTKEIRVPADLIGLHGIICPGGESTAMAIIGEKCGLIDALKLWVQENKPIWGTCAGMILLSDHALKQAVGGQSLVGGLDVHVCRNYFGSQIFSCEYEICTKHAAFEGSRGIFIRAPAIIQAGSGVDILGKVVAHPHSNAVKEVETTVNSGTLVPHEEATARNAGFTASPQQVDNSADVNNANQVSYEVAVAVQQGNILATAFHPELTNDLRWHRYFLEIVAHDSDKHLV